MRTKLIIPLFCSLFFIAGCKKEGCTDAEATNFNSEANEDDGTCTYECQTSFWFNENISNWLAVTYGVTELTVFIDNTSVGTMDPTEWKVGPDCGGQNFTTTSDLGGVNSKQFTYSVRDQTGTEQFGGSYTNTAGNCYSIELKW